MARRKRAKSAEAGRTAIDVGARLKAQRIKSGLTQRDLASKAGVTNGMISMIEQNKHSPSVATLNRLTDALGLSFAEFFSIELPEMPRVFYMKDELVALTEGKVRFAVVAGERPEKALQILHEVYAPGGDTGVTMLTHRGEEGGLVIAGEVEVTVGDQRRVLGPGDAYYFESMTPHRFRNVGKSAAIIVSACTPPFM
ncbi:cupin domain-containing protein [Hyphomicrobium sp.]|uniref:cupin domain-containing protein n=1 Tax=Hyphomicrobium sp. TaxID=82 RepID=UPI002E32F863|nr:cupin domain-containing protein [Hyphomicrobium sp.]HEX2842804.1 cupin domain-containing protein [Hyphomicrobium sp.]